MELQAFARVPGLRQSPPACAGIPQNTELTTNIADSSLLL